MATVCTASDGTFRIEYDPGEDDNSPHELTINDEPYDSRYSTNRASYIRGETRDLGDIEVRRTAAPRRTTPRQTRVRRGVVVFAPRRYAACCAASFSASTCVSASHAKPSRPKWP